MWLAKKSARAGVEREEGARIGAVTIAGASPAAECGGERRALMVASPGGVAWLPRVGEEALLLRCGDGEAVAGVLSAASAGLQPGEVCVFSAGGATLLLKNDGTVLLTGNVEVTGTLKINGAPVATAAI